MRKKSATFTALLLFVLILLTSCAHSHSFGKWEEHGTYQSRTCEACGYTEKEYYNDANELDSGSEQASSAYDDGDSVNEPVENEKYVCTRVDFSYEGQYGMAADSVYYILFDYDSNGNQKELTKDNYYGKDGNSASVSTFCCWTFEQTSSGNFTNVTETTENGQKVEMRETTENNDKKVWKVVYDTNGNPQSETLVKADIDGGNGTMIWDKVEVLYNYDNAGRLAKAIVYFGGYDGNNHCITNKTKCSTSVFTYRTLSEYLCTNSKSNEIISEGNQTQKKSGDVSTRSCSACLGNGSYECTGCDGAGKVLSYYEAYGHTPVYRTCSICNGNGSVSCKVCGGDGTIYD